MPGGVFSAGGSPSTSVAAGGGQPLGAGTGTAPVSSGTGVPNGAVTGTVGSLYLQLDGPNGNTLWRKRTNGGTAGWGLMQNDLGIISVADLGAVGDGVADDTAFLNQAFAIAGAVIWLPRGTYKVTAPLIAQKCSRIYGAGEDDIALIIPTAALNNSNVFSVGFLGGSVYPRVVQGFKIDGVNTTNATGMVVGSPASAAIELSHVIIRRFVGGTGVGLRMAECLKGVVSMCTIQACNTNELVQPIADLSFPTTITHQTCVFGSATGVGVQVNAGRNIRFAGCDFESNGNEGIVVSPVANATCSVTIDGESWFESNYGSDGVHFDVRTTGAAAGSICELTVGNTRFTGGAKSVSVTNSTRAILTRNIYPNTPGTISCDATSTGEINHWDPGGGSYASLVSDPNNNLLRVDAFYGAWTSYVPAFGSDLGNEAFTFNGALTSHVFYKIVGKVLFLRVTVTGTLKAVTPGYLTLTLPAGVVPADLNWQIMPASTKNTAWEAGKAQADTVGNIMRWYRAADAAFTSAAAVGMAANLFIEIA